MFVRFRFSSKLLAITRKLTISRCPNTASVSSRRPVSSVAATSARSSAARPSSSVSRSRSTRPSSPSASPSASRPPRLSRPRRLLLVRKRACVWRLSRGGDGGGRRERVSESPPSSFRVLCAITRVVQASSSCVREWRALHGLVAVDLGEPATLSLVLLIRSLRNTLVSLVETSRRSRQRGKRQKAISRKGELVPSLPPQGEMSKACWKMHKEAVLPSPDPFARKAYRLFLPSPSLALPPTLPFPFSQTSPKASPNQRSASPLATRPSESTISPKLRARVEEEEARRDLLAFEEWVYSSVRE